MASFGGVREKVRRSYLQAMGVQVWFSRKILPKAKAPSVMHCMDFSELVVNEVEQRNQNDNVTIINDNKVEVQKQKRTGAVIGLKREVSLASDLLGTEKLTSKEKEVTSEEVAEKMSQSPAEPVFAFAVQAVGESMLVMVQLPMVKAELGLSPLHCTFLEDVLWTLGYGIREHNFQAQYFVWPLGWPNHDRGLLAGVEQDEEAARGAVHAYLEHRFNWRQKKTLCILGKMVAKYVLPLKDGFVDIGGWYIQKNEQRILVSYSLDELMEVPALKKELWEEINYISKY